MTERTQRILFLPDQINGIDSGGISARATVAYLTDLGHHVAVYSQDAIDSARHIDLPSKVPLYQIPSKMRWHTHIHSPALLKDFRKILQDFRPSYIFFAGGIQKPASFAREARNKNIRTIYLFYINEYFCPILYAGTEDGPCTDCMRNPFSAPFKNKCFSLQGLPHVIKYQTIKSLLSREIYKAHKVVGYGQDQLDLARQFGVNDKNLGLIGFQFNAEELTNLPSRDDGYFALTGQTIIQKGWHLLNLILDALESKIHLKISFRSEHHARTAIETFNLARHVKSGVIEVVSTLDSRTQYLDFLAASRAVLLPTYYPTTGEFGLQEPMALGKPVHVFNVGVHRDVLIDRQNALVSNVGDIIDYAGKIDEINQNSVLRSVVSAGARSSSRDFYSTSQIELLNGIFEPY